MPIDNIVIISLPIRHLNAGAAYCFPSALMTGYHGMNWAIGNKLVTSLEYPAATSPALPFRRSAD